MNPREIADRLNEVLKKLTDIVEYDGVQNITGNFLIDLMIKPLTKVFQVLIIPIMLFLAASTALTIFIPIISICTGDYSLNAFDYVIFICSTPGWLLFWNWAIRKVVDIYGKYKGKIESYNIKYKDDGK